MNLAKERNVPSLRIVCFKGNFVKIQIIFIAIDIDGLYFYLCFFVEGGLNLQVVEAEN